MVRDSGGGAEPREERLPKSVYGALVAGTEKATRSTTTPPPSVSSDSSPMSPGSPRSRDQATTVMGQEISLPVLMSPTGVQAVHPDGEVAVARAAAARGTAVGLSCFASKPIERWLPPTPDLLPDLLGGKPRGDRGAHGTREGRRWRSG